MIHIFITNEMSRKAKQEIAPESNESIKEEEIVQSSPPPISISKSDYLKARETIKTYRKSQKDKPKRKCTEKQLAALAAGRAKNPRNKSKS